jgi:hypothetical protein
MSKSKIPKAKIIRNLDPGEVRRGLIGILACVAAIFILLSGIGVISLAINLWQIIVAAICIGIIVKSILNLTWFGIFLPIAMLITLFPYELGLNDVSSWQIWAGAALLAFGATYITNAWRASSTATRQKSNKKES